MRLLATCVMLLALAAPPSAAQQPTMSEYVRGQLVRDTTLTLWFFGNRTFQLGTVRSTVLQLGGRVRQQSRWLHAVSAVAHTSAIRRASRRPEFRHLQPVAVSRGRPERATPVGAPQLRAGGTTSDSLFGEAATPLRLLNLFPLIDNGLTGSGVRIAILDTGFETLLPAFASASVINEFDFVSNDSVVRNEPGDPAGQSNHGTSVWSLLAADVPGTFRGIALGAEYLLAKTEDETSERRIEEDNWVAAIEWADSIGVDIVSSSVGYRSFDDGFAYQPRDLNGDIAVTTIAADSAAARGILVVTAVGNLGSSGFRSLITPADGDSVIAVGSVDTLGTIASFSSRGPTADRRIKPDLVAPGVAVLVLDPGSGFVRSNGTSFSTPLIAGTAALMRELNPTIGPLQIRDALRATGSNRDSPDSLVGWGRPDGAAAAYFPGGIHILVPTGTDLTTVTPTISLDVPQISALALPVNYRIKVSTDSAMTSIILDTVTTSTQVALLDPLRPGETIVIQASVTSVDSVTLSTPFGGVLSAPAWVTLSGLSDSAGSTIREPRPTFFWTSPDVMAPPGPFVYDLQVIRDDDGFAELVERDITDTSFRPTRDLELNTPYRWQVTARLGPDTATSESIGTFLIVDDSAPVVTLLFQNFPNPFPNRLTGQPVTCFWFDLAEGGRVQLDILDLRGHVVRNLVPGEAFPPSLPPGRYGRPAVGGTGSCDPRLTWDGSLTAGGFVPRGIYLARLKTPTEAFFKRVVYMGRGF